MRSFLCVHFGNDFRRVPPPPRLRQRGECLHRIFNGPPPTAVKFGLVDAGIDKFDKHGKRPGILDEWTILSRNLKNEVEAFEMNLRLTQDELDDDFQDFALIQSISRNAYTTVSNGLVSTKVIALVLNWIQISVYGGRQFDA